MTAADPSDVHAKLRDEDSGVWYVETASGSTYRFDLDARTVERVGGKLRPAAAPADTVRALRGIIEIRIGRPGRWWMRNDGGYLDPTEVWQWSSVVTRIGPYRCQPTARD